MGILLLELFLTTTITSTLGYLTLSQPIDAVFPETEKHKEPFYNLITSPSALNPTSFSGIVHCCNEDDSGHQTFANHTVPSSFYKQDSIIRNNLCPRNHHHYHQSHYKPFDIVESATFIHEDLAEGLGLTCAAHVRIKSIVFSYSSITMKVNLCLFTILYPHSQQLVIFETLGRGGEAVLLSVEAVSVGKLIASFHEALEKFNGKSPHLPGSSSFILKIKFCSVFGSVFGYFLAYGVVVAYILGVSTLSSYPRHHTVENAGYSGNSENATENSTRIPFYKSNPYSVDDNMRQISLLSSRTLAKVNCQRINCRRLMHQIPVMRLKLMVCWLILSSGLCTSSIGEVTSLAGVISSANGIGTNTRFNSPRGVSISPDGSYALVADTINHLIRHIMISTASVTTLAGAPLLLGSTNGIGSNARFASPLGVCISPDGSYALVADTNNHLIRHLIISTASVTTLVGLALTSGAIDGIGTNSQFHTPNGVAISQDGSFALVADTKNCLIRRIIISTASVTTLAGTAGIYGSTNGIGTSSQFNNPYAVSIAPSGSFALVSDTVNHLIRHIILSTASVTTFVGLFWTIGTTNGIGTNAIFYGPRGISISPDGSYALVADSVNHLIRHIIISTASVTTFAGATGGFIDGIGTNSAFTNLFAVSISPGGSYALVADSSNHLIRHIIISTVSVTTLVGSTGPIGSIDGIGAISRFNFPRKVTLSPDGSYALVADTSNHLIRRIIISTSSVTTLGGLALTSGAIDGIGTNSRFNGPSGVFISPDGSYALVADTSNHLIRHIILSTVSVTTLGGLALTTGSTNGIGTNSRFNNPYAVSISLDGSYALVADSSNHLIRHIILSTASVTTLAGTAGMIAMPTSLNGIGTNARFNTPRCVSISPDGSYALVADSNTRLIRHVIISTAYVTTFAGTVYSSGSTNGIGTNSKFNTASGVTISPDGSYALVADTLGFLIRRIIISTASVTTLAGTAGTSGSIDEIGSNSQFNNPTGVTISPDGSYALVADTVNHLIRHIILSISSPSCVPSIIPTFSPSSPPTHDPSSSSTFFPPSSPTLAPSSSPTSGDPSFGDSTAPPTGQPTGKPTGEPTGSPTGQPTGEPSGQPSGQPTAFPSSDPSRTPTSFPSLTPNVPTLRPSIAFSRPTYEPSTSPTVDPSTSPTLDPSTSPTLDPSTSPTVDPSTSPTLDPSAMPTFAPTFQPTSLPTSAPSFKPVFPRVPTLVPTFRMRSRPSKAPTFAPSFDPTTSFSPTPKPTTASPTVNPSIVPTSYPTGAPTCHPTRPPTSRPSSLPTFIPSTTPTSPPSGVPSAAPTFSPTSQPTSPTPAPIPNTPSQRPTLFPSTCPTRAPSNRPTMRPTRAPTKGAGGGIRLESLTTNKNRSRNYLQTSGYSSGSTLSKANAHSKGATTSSTSKAPPQPLTPPLQSPVLTSGSKSTRQSFSTKPPTAQLSLKNNVPTKLRRD